jgi:hypothetical protein
MIPSSILQCLGISNMYENCTGHKASKIKQETSFTCDYSAGGKNA